MARRTRVYELAKELGISSNDVLAKLKEFGEFVKSPSSLIEAPVANRVRACYPNRPDPVPSQRHPEPVPPTVPLFERPDIQQRLNDPLDELYLKPRYANQPRKSYKGESPSDLTKFLLDEYIVPTRRESSSKPRTTYWVDEVEDAKRLSDEWAPALLEGMSFDDVLAWLRGHSMIRVEDAVALHAAGIRPSEIERNDADKDLDTLGVRLLMRKMTVDQVILEVKARRQA